MIAIGGRNHGTVGDGTSISESQAKDHESRQPEDRVVEERGFCERNQLNEL